MLFDALDIFSDIGIESRDPDRFFSKEYKYKKLVTQWSPLKKKKVHFECALSGKEITEDNSAADHIHPHDFTGETALKNLQVLAKDVNARKGTMSNDEYLDKYRDMHLKELADAAEAQKNEYMHKVKKNEYVHKAETYEYAV
jgi:5-methylcytosine-specific restriction endonuclease McrA